MMKPFYLTFFLFLSLVGFGCAAPAVADDGDDTCPVTDDECPGPDDYIDPKHPLPDYMVVVCTGQQVDEEARIKTMARMMDWCYCGNELNTKGLEYAGFSVYEDGVDLTQRTPSRTWACSKNKHEPCDAVEDWYNAQGNVSRDCGAGWTGYFYDAHRQNAWGFGSYQDKEFCDHVPWVSAAM